MLGSVELNSELTKVPLLVWPAAVESERCKGDMAEAKSAARRKMAVRLAYCMQTDDKADGQYAGSRGSK